MIEEELFVMMRSTAEALQAFEATVERYLSELENLDMEQLLKKRMRRNGPSGKCTCI